MRLIHNLASLNIYNQMIKTERAQANTINRVSTGVKVNNASDDPYVLAQSETQRMQIRGMQMVQRNLQDGISMLQTAGSAMESVSTMIQRIRELTVQSGGVNTTGDKVIIQKEIDQMKNAINDVVRNTEFNGVKLLNDSSVAANSAPGALSMTAGSNAYENVDIPRFDLVTGKLGDETAGKFLDSIDITVNDGISQELQVIDSAMTMVLNARSKYGALETRFDSMYSNSGEIEDTVQRAESNLRDTDIASDMIEFGRNKILMDAGNALLVQTNNFPMEILRILENVKR